MINAIYEIEFSNFHQAESILSKIETSNISDPLNQYAILLNNKLYLRKNEISKALEFINRIDTSIIKNHSKLELLYSLQKARTNSHRGYLKAALEDLSNVLNVENYYQAAQIRGSIAEIYSSAKMYTEAINYLIKSDSILRLNGDTLNYQFISNRNREGMIYYFQGTYEQVVQPWEKGINITQKTFGSSHTFIGDFTANLTVIYEKLGNNEKALENGLLSLDNTEKRLGKNNTYYATTLNNIALTLRRMKKPDQAITFIKDAISIVELIGDTSVTKYGLYLDQLASCYQELGRLDTAFTYFKKGVAHAERINGKESFAYNYRSNNLAGNLSRRGLYQEALDIYESLLEPLAKIVGTRHPEYATRLTNIASSYEDLGKYKEAVQPNIRCTENLLGRIYNYYPALSSSQKIKFINKQRALTDRLFGLTYKYVDEEVGKYVQDLNLAIKGLSLSSLQNLSERIDHKQVIEWKEIKKQIATIYNRRKKEGDEVLLDSLQNIAADYEIEILRNSKVDFHLDQRKWQDLQNALNENEIAVDFYHFQLMNGSYYTDTVMYGAIITSPIKGPIIKILCKERDLVNALQVYEKSKDSRPLYELIWEPLKPEIKDRKVHISPSGQLFRVPFNAIKNNEGDFWINRNKIHFYQNLRDFINRNTKLKDDQWLNDITIFANPDFNQSEEDETKWSETDVAFNNDFRSLLSNNNRSILSFGELPGTQKEARMIESIFDQNQTSVYTFSGLKASESNLKRLDHSLSDILHIATHGFFFNEYKGEKSDQNLRARLITSDNPLLRSGLALAGSNTYWKSDMSETKGEDGIITSIEISNLDLSSTNLVVLSACETALGDISDTEGVYGLQRAFKMAGAENIIMSLWKVPDEETAILMSLFYKNLKKTRDIADSLRAAQLSMSSSYEPFYWAGFILVQ